MDPFKGTHIAFKGSPESGGYSHNQKPRNPKPLNLKPSTLQGASTMAPTESADRSAGTRRATV